nr:cation-transporting P-type ATPase [Akkermansia muciniphila]
MKSAAHHQGLSEQQVLENRIRYGINILTPPEKAPCGSNFWRNFQTPSSKFCWWPCSCP